MTPTTKPIGLSILLLAVALAPSLQGATGTLFPNPWFNAFDSNGNPVSGAKACFYTAGTSTPATTYSDVTLLTPNSNPVVADTSGRVGPVYLTPGQSYKLILQDATGTAGVCDGAVIRTQDNIAAVPTSSNNIDITGTAGEAISAGNCVYLSDGSGSKSAGSWYKCDSANAYSSTTPEVGMAPAAISSGSTGTIRLSGSVTGLTVSVGSEYFVGTAGALTSTAPILKRHLGHADSATSLVLTGDPPPTGTIDNTICDCRLTLTSGTPVTTADVTAAANIFLDPFKGNRIALFDGSSTWTIRTFTEITQALGTLTSGRPYDVFAFDNSGVVSTEILAWTSTSARATALTTQDGVLVKSGATTRRYLGTFYTTSATTTEDSLLKRDLWNYYNRVPRLLAMYPAATTWTYTTSTWRQANGAAANQVECVVGWSEVELALQNIQSVSVAGGGQTLIGIGEDSTTTPSTSATAMYTSYGAAGAAIARISIMPVVGYHFYTMLERGDGVNTSNFFANNNSTRGDKGGMHGRIEG